MEILLIYKLACLFRPGLDWEAADWIAIFVSIQQDITYLSEQESGRFRAAPVRGGFSQFRACKAGIIIACLRSSAWAREDFFCSFGGTGYTYIPHGRLLVDLCLEILENALVDHFGGCRLLVRSEVGSGRAYR